MMPLTIAVISRATIKVPNTGQLRPLVSPQDRDSAFVPRWFSTTSDGIVAISLV